MSIPENQIPEYVDPANQPGACSRSRAAAGSHYFFTNRHGNTIKLPGSATIEDLVKLGVTKVGFKKPAEPLENGEWRESGSSENTKDSHGVRNERS